MVVPPHLTVFTPFLVHISRERRCTGDIVRKDAQVYPFLKFVGTYRTHHMQVVCAGAEKGPEKVFLWYHSIDQIHIYSFCPLYLFVLGLLR